MQTLLPISRTETHAAVTACQQARVRASVMCARVPLNAMGSSKPCCSERNGRASFENQEGARRISSAVRHI